MEDWGEKEGMDQTLRQQYNGDSAVVQISSLAIQTEYSPPDKAVLKRSCKFMSMQSDFKPPLNNTVFD